MGGLTSWGTLGIVGAFLSLGAAGGVQGQRPTPRLDVAKIVTQLGVTEQVRSAIVPELTQVNALLARRTATGSQLVQVSDSLNAIFTNVFARLAPAQRAQLRRALWDAGAAPGRGGYMGYGHMGSGNMGYGHMGSMMGSAGGWSGHMGYMADSTTGPGAAWCWGSGTMPDSAGRTGGRGHMGFGHMYGVGQRGWR
jgi:hypothetical protein